MKRCAIATCSNNGEPRLSDGLVTCFLHRTDVIPTMGADGLVHISGPLGLIQAMSVEAYEMCCADKRRELERLA